MGKAARRRKAHRKNYLVGLSHHNQESLKFQLEIRVQSWLKEISILARKWAIGEDGYQKRIFEILDDVIEILQDCEVSEKYASEIRNLICSECCSQVAKVVDSRLYRLSNTDRLVYKAKKTGKIIFSAKTC